MADHDYIFRHTTSTDGSFAVKPHSANGPSSPSSTVPYSGLGARAVSINTPFVLVGKGVAEYGQIVQNNILYLAENFCNPTRPIPPMKGMIWYKNTNQIDVNYPADPVDAGLYVWNGMFWNTILIDGNFANNLNLNGKRITNVGDATAPGDALNTTTANTKYLQLGGGTLTGNLNVGTITLGNVPVADTDAATKKYVDDVAADVAAGGAGSLTGIIADIAAINAQLPAFYKSVGGPITGSVSIDGDLSISAGSAFTLPAGSGVVSFGGRVIQEVGAPVLAYDATNKTYVDDAIAFAVAAIVVPAGGGSADGVVSNGLLDATGTLTLTRTKGLPPVVISGSFAQKSHSHAATEISFDPTINARQSVFNASSAPPTNVETALATLDRYVVNLINDPVRTVIKQTVLNNTDFTFAAQYEYTVWSDRLMVFLNGVKQYADTRSESGIEFSGVSLRSVIGITPQSYNQDITVDSVPYTMTINVTATTTYLELLSLLRSSITANSIPVRCVLEQSSADIKMTFVATSSGSGHPVTLTDSVGQLFRSIPTASAPIEELGESYAYTEVGDPGEDSLDIAFATAPAINALLEVIVYR